MPIGYPVPGIGYTLAALTRDLSRLLQPTLDGVATGGSGTTLVDTARTEPDEHWSLGTIWFGTGANNGASAIVSDYDLATTTFTFVTPGAACAAGHLYSVAAADYPRSELIQAINRALVDIGPIALIDSSLVTVASQEDYTLPAGVHDIRRVEIDMYTTGNRSPVVHQGWKYVDYGVLRFLPGRAPDWNGATIRITHIPHVADQLSDDGDLCSVFVQPALVLWKAAVHAHRARLIRDRGQEDFITNLLNEAIARAEDVEQRFPVRRPANDTILGGYGY